MHRLVGFCCAVLVGCGIAAGASSPRLAPDAPSGQALAALLHGKWEGEREGDLVTWQMDGEGRGRVDGRPADLEIRGDTLRVEFDPPPSAAAGAARETAVYRFVASVSPRGISRLFVYGFDLGKNGIHFTREVEPEPIEDAAPPVPATEPVPAGAARPAVAAGPVHRTDR